MPAIVLQRMEALADENPAVYECFRDLVDQLNQVMPSILVGENAPNSSAPGGASIPASPGTLYIQSNAKSGALAIHVKDSGFDDNGWATLGAFGSIPPTSAGGFPAVATPNSISFYYDGTNGSKAITLFRADGTKVQIASGRTVVNGLQPNTTYFFYPYYDERSGTLKWVAGTVGNPAIASLADSSNSSQLASLTGVIPLSAGISVTVTTPVSGTTVTIVGGGFGGTGRLS